MIKLFKKLRLNLIAQGRKQKYLQYAVGEIILVVIGILIALQINNWNQSIKTANEERELLTLIKTSIEGDLLEMRNLLMTINKEVDAADRILYQLEHEDSYPDSLHSDFAILTTSRRLTINQAGIRAFEEKGKIVSNDKLRHEIVELYFETYPKIPIAIENFRSNLNTFFRPLLKNRFIYPIVRETITEGGNINYPLKPVDFKSLKKDLEFTNAVKTCRNNFAILIKSYQTTIDSIQAVSKAISIELNKK